LRKTVLFPFSLGEKVADEVGRMRALARTLTPNPSLVACRETGVLPNALWEEGRRGDE
jgi:hypothetical protein